jgi:V-type H+-transporting ATPase subunit F
MAGSSDLEGALVAVIADEDTITGFLLAGVGDVDLRKRSNFLVVDGKTTVRHVEAAFKDFTSREDVAIVLISQPIANMIRHVVSAYNKVRRGCRVSRVVRRCADALFFLRLPPGPTVAPTGAPPQPVPALLEIPSKDAPYDPQQDSLLRRVKLLLGMA